MNVEVEKLPRKILEKAVMLSDSIKRVYITLYVNGEPATASEVAKRLGLARSYVSMRLNQLELMGLVKRKHKGRKVLFGVVL